MPYTLAKSGESMTSTRIGIAPWLMASGLAFGAFAGTAPPAGAATSTGPAATAAIGTTIDTNLAGPPAGPSMVFTGTANQPLGGTLPGSSAAIPVSFTVTNAGLLPPGVAINAAGTVTGIPTADGVYAATVTACDALGCTPGTVTFAIAPDQAPCDNQPPAGPVSLGSAAIALAVANLRVGT
jgi:hypothetical protein